MSDIVTLNGYKIKDEKAVRSYDTVALMKADTKLKEGYHVKTKGYYEANDGGNGEYVIVDDETLVDDGGLIHVLSNGLRAKLINEPLKPELFGAYGDGIHDDGVKLNKFFQNVKSNQHITLHNNYATSEPIQLPTGYGISINGGSFTALSNFDNSEHNALLYNISSSVEQPDNYNVSATGLRLSNLTFMCNNYADGIEMAYSLNMNIDKCLFFNYKNYGINVNSLDSHDLIISNCQFRGNSYNADTSNLSNIGISLSCPDSIVKNCIFASGYGGLELKKGANIIEGCHFYAHQNHGFNLKMGSFENIVSDCYFDGGAVWLSSGWRNLINNCLFVVSNRTEYMVKVTVDSGNMASFRIENCLVNDERTDTSTPINFITEYSNNITNFSNTKMLNNQLISGNVIFNNPLNGIQINEINPSFLGMSKYIADVNTTNYSIGTFTQIDGQTQYYKSVVSGNTNEIEFIGESDFYKYLVVPFVITERSRIIADLTSTSSATAFFYDSEHNFISYNKATLEPGLYYVAVYKTVTRCVLKVNV